MYYHASTNPLENHYSATDILHYDKVSVGAQDFTCSIWVIRFEAGLGYIGRLYQLCIHQLLFGFSFNQFGAVTNKQSFPRYLLYKRFKLMNLQFS